MSHERAKLRQKYTEDKRWMSPTSHVDLGAKVLKRFFRKKEAKIFAAPDQLRKKIYSKNYQCGKRVLPAEPTGHKLLSNTT